MRPVTLDSISGMSGCIATCSLTKSGTQTTTANTYTKVTFDGASGVLPYVGGTGKADLTNNRIYITVGGIYLDASLLVVDNGNWIGNWRLYKNGSATGLEYKLQQDTNAVTTAAQPNGQLLTLVAGDYIEMFSKANASDPTRLVATTTQLRLIRLRDA